MATTATNVYWSKDYRYLNGRCFIQTPYGDEVDATTFTTGLTRPLLEPFDFYPTDPPHECEVIQRMSEAYRANVI